LGLQDKQQGIEKIKAERDNKVETTHRNSAKKKQVFEETICWKPDHNPGYNSHDHKGKYGIDYIDNRQVLHSEPLQKSGLCKIIEQDAGGADEKIKNCRPEKQFSFILVDIEPFAQKFSHQVPLFRYDKGFLL
jgi:hypothetical protein